MMGKSQEQPTNICRSKPWFPFNFPLNQCSMSIVSSDLGIGCDWVGSKSLTVFHAVDGWWFSDSRELNNTNTMFKWFQTPWIVISMIHIRCRLVAFHPQFARWLLPKRGNGRHLSKKKQSTQKCGKIHPLVNVYITSPWYIGKPTLNHQFSIAMLVYQRVFLVGDTRLACWSLSVSLDFTVRTFFAPRAIAWGRLYHPIVSIPGSFTMALIPVVSIPFSMD